MPDIDIAALRERAGLTAEQLPDDASVDQINAALAAEQEPPAEGGAGAEGEGAGAAAGAEPIAARTLPEGPVAVDAETWETVQAGARAGAELAATTARRERDEVITAAIRDGRFAPARREHYERAWDADAEGTRTLLTASVADGGLAPNTIPRREIGAAERGGEGTVPDSLTRVLASIPHAPSKSVVQNGASR